MRLKGIVTSWNDAKGFGFVTPMTGGTQVFLHIKAFRDRSRRPSVDDVVTFTMGKDNQERPCATLAALAGNELRPEKSKRRNLPLISGALLFLGAIGVPIAAGLLPITIGAVYAVLGPVTFGVYALDKSAARRGAWRTPESTLHLLGLAGGWPGALIAQQMLRHKSKKASFLAVFWVTALVNCGAVIWMLTEDGKAMLDSLLT